VCVCVCVCVCVIVGMQPILNPPHTHNDDAADYDAADYDADNNGDRYVRVPSGCHDVLCLAPRTRTRHFVFTVWDAIAGFFPACP
jgi:hypothetical protein